MISGLHVIEGFLNRLSAGLKLFIERMLGAPELKALFGGQSRTAIRELSGEEAVERIEFVHDDNNLDQDLFSIPVIILAAGRGEVNQGSPASQTRTRPPVEAAPSGAERDSVIPVPRPRRVKTSLLHADWQQVGSQLY